MDKMQERPEYQKPELIDLIDIAESWTVGPCSPGSGNLTTGCYAGSAAANACTGGSGVAL